MPRNALESDAEIIQLASEITQYLAQREGAADTFKGLVSWWVLRQRLSEAEIKVSLAIEYLCDSGIIQKRELADGGVLYMAKTASDSANEIENGHAPD